MEPGGYEAGLELTFAALADTMAHGSRACFDRLDGYLVGMARR